MERGLRTTHSDHLCAQGKPNPDLTPEGAVPPYRHSSPLVSLVPPCGIWHLLQVSGERVRKRCPWLMDHPGLSLGQSSINSVLTPQMLHEIWRQQVVSGDLWVNGCNGSGYPASSFSMTSPSAKRGEQGPWSPWSWFLSGSWRRVFERPGRGRNP